MKRLLILLIVMAALAASLFQNLVGKVTANAKTEALPMWPERIVHQPSGIALILIPSGEFQMGSPTSEPDRSPMERQHHRFVRQPFYIGETEVTVEQFRKFVQETGYLTDAERGVEEGGRYGKGAFASTVQGDRQWNATANWRNPFPNLKQYKLNNNHPVVQITWADAQQFVEHFALRLPTEAQWEYAARAGTHTRFFWGSAEAQGKGFGNVADTSGHKRFAYWNLFFPFDDGTTLLADVGQYKANPWKLYDIVGNVSEWCQDSFAKDYPRDGSDESPVPGDNNSVRVIRGGSWLDAPDTQRSAKRIGFAPHSRRDFVGFRVVMNIGNEAPPQ